MGFWGWVRVRFAEERAGPWLGMGYAKSKQAVGRRVCLCCMSIPR